jgi:TPP-dependent indolepyruvate ferredoxin oxidoreductase alpha subunit
MLAENGARLVYTTNRVVHGTLKGIQKEYLSFEPLVSLNEKIALELALAGSYASKKTACIFSTEGLYEALDPLMSSAYTGVLGGYLILCVRETEERVTPVGLFSKVPVIVAEERESLAQSIRFGYTISAQFETPVIIETTPEAAGYKGPEANEKANVPQRENHSSHFAKNPSRWAATPKFRYELHEQLNRKIEKIREEFERFDGNRVIKKGKTGVIATSPAHMDLFDDEVSVLFLSTVFPLPLSLVEKFISDMEKVSIAEGRYPAVELQIPDRRKIIGASQNIPGERKKPEETMYGFSVVRDQLGPASSINMVHGVAKTDPDRKLLAITFEDHFFHSGLPAFVNSIYNQSAYALLIMVNEREEEMKDLLKGFGFTNYFHLDNIAEIERFRDNEALTVFFCKGII